MEVKLRDDQARKSLLAGNDLQFFYPAPAPRFVDALYTISLLSDRRVECTVRYPDVRDPYNKDIATGHFDHWGNFIMSLPPHLRNADWQVDGNQNLNIVG